METLVIVGFVLLLTGWFGMFFRVRRDHPNREAAKYGSYTGPSVFGLRFGRRSAFSLVMFYWRHYGVDAWFAAAVLGILLIVIAAVG
ncbi:MAG: hypothetical protein ACREP8_13255, partial [Candidatus Binatia bacterium]